MPLYLLPWTFLIAAAARRAWARRRTLGEDGRTIRFALACTLPPLAILSLAATARNIYLAPALPGAALLLAWWARETLAGVDLWDVRALRATAVMMMIGALGFAAALTLVALDAWPSIAHGSFVSISALGLLLSLWLAMRAWSSARAQPMQTQWSLFLAYCVLLAAPASQLYRQVDAWQNLSDVSRAMQRDAGRGPLILLSPDETTRAIVDMYAPNDRSPTPLLAPDAATAGHMAGTEGVILVQLPKLPLSVVQRFRTSSHTTNDAPPWIAAANLRIWKEYAVPNGRRYALLRNSP